MHIESMLHVFLKKKFFIQFSFFLEDWSEQCAQNGNLKAKLIAYYILFSHSINHKKISFTSLPILACSRAHTNPQSHSMINNRYYIFFACFHCMLARSLASPSLILFHSFT